MASSKPLQSFWQKSKKVAAWLFLGFMALFLGRLLCSFVAGVEPQQQSRPALAPAVYLESSLKNYRQVCANNLGKLLADVPATAVNEDLGIAGQLNAAQIDALEVYTNEARIGSLTSRFEEDVAKALAAVEEHNAEVRLENSTGVKPSRSFSVVLRVPTGRFDACVAALSEIGEVQSSAVTKEDKSEEVRQRFAERDSLKAYAASLAKLRATDGQVGELINLESQIQSVERQIQALNASLGEFVRKESFYNINFSLQERIEVFVDEDKYPLAARVVAAFVWTVNTYAAGVSVLAVVALTIGSVRVVRRG